MPRPSEVTLARLSRIADDLRETFSERGYRVNAAVAVDPAFGSGRTLGSLARDLAIDTVRTSATEHGVHIDQTSLGDALDLIIDDAAGRHKCRARKAEIRPDGSYAVMTSSDAFLQVDEDSLYGTSLWVFAWTFGGDDFQICDIFLAPVLGITGDSVQYFVLGNAIALGSAPVGGPSGGFNPTDEELEGFEDDDFDEGTEAS